MSDKKAGYLFVSVILAIMVSFSVAIGYVQCGGKVMIPYQTIKHDTVMVEVSVDHVVDQDILERTDTVIRVDTVIKPVRGRTIIEYHNDTITDTVFEKRTDTLVEYKYLKPKTAAIDWLIRFMFLLTVVVFVAILTFGKVSNKR